MLFKWLRAEAWPVRSVRFTPIMWLPRCSAWPKHGECFSESQATLGQQEKGLCLCTFSLVEHPPPPTPSCDQIGQYLGCSFHTMRNLLMLYFCHFGRYYLCLRKSMNRGVFSRDFKCFLSRALFCETVSGAQADLSNQSCELHALRSQCRPSNLFCAQHSSFPLCDLC